MIKIMGMGDILLDRKNNANPFSSVLETLCNANIIFGNCEGVYAKEWERTPSCGVPLVSDPSNISVLQNANIKIMSLANNHSLDGGYKALLSTIENLQKAGIKTVGAGINEEEAYKPVFIESNGTKIAFLAYTTVFPVGYEARNTVPGVGAVKVETFYVPWEKNEWHPGLLPNIITMTNPNDLNKVLNNVKYAKQNADIVIVSMHWGDPTCPYALTDYERREAKNIIDAGADAIFGHHHHMLRGIEIYKDRPIFYGLGNFIFDLPNLNEKLQSNGYLTNTNPIEKIKMQRRFGDYLIAEKEDYPYLPFHADSRMTGIVNLEFNGEDLKKIEFIPCVLNNNNFPILIKQGSKQENNILDYLNKCNEYEFVSTKISINYLNDNKYITYTISK